MVISVYISIHLNQAEAQQYHRLQDGKFGSDFIIIYQLFLQISTVCGELQYRFQL